MRGDFYKQLTSNLETARAEGLFKEERIITSAQQADITVGDSHVINFCANNYLGLANHPELIAAAKSGMDSHGFGMASVRFICGTQDTHKQLEKKLADFLGMEDAILKMVDHATHHLAAVQGTSIVHRGEDAVDLQPRVEAVGDLVDGLHEQGHAAHRKEQVGTGERSELLKQLDDLDQRVNAVALPLSHTAELFDLRNNIYATRKRLLAKRPD